MNSEENNHLDTRTTYVKLENGWKYIHQAMVRKWTVHKLPSISKCTININGVEVRPGKETDAAWIFTFPLLRKKWFDYLGLTSNECDLLALEDACMAAQLQGMNHYQETPLDEIRGCLFTPPLTIVFMPQLKKGAKDVPTRIEITEQYIVSDVHKKQTS